MRNKQILTALSILTNHGLREVARVSREKVGMWWRHGNGLDLGRFVGRPTNVARLDGCRFRLDGPTVSEEIRYLLLSSKYEAPERALIRRYVDASLPLVEFGGALGVVSCIANKLLEDPARHVVVEANPFLMPVLTANRDLNGCTFTVLNRAVAYEPMIPFYVAGDVLASSVRRTGECSVAVPATTLQDILDERGFRRCTLICDIEGMEVELVRREAQTLGDRVDILIMEVHDQLVGLGESKEVLRTLHRLGFDILDRLWDTIALRNRRHSRAGKHLGGRRFRPRWYAAKNNAPCEGSRCH